MEKKKSIVEELKLDPVSINGIRLRKEDEEKLVNYLKICFDQGCSKGELIGRVTDDYMDNLKYRDFVDCNGNSVDLKTLQSIVRAYYEQIDQKFGTDD